MAAEGGGCVHTATGCFTVRCHVEHPSVQGPLARNSDPPGKLIRTRRDLPQDPVPVRKAGHCQRLQAQARQRDGGPAIPTLWILCGAIGLGRWLRHHEDSVDLEKGGRALGHHRRGAERPGHHHVEGGSICGITSDVFCPGDDNPHPRAPLTTADGLGEELATPNRSVEEDARSQRPPISEDQARQPPARTQVDPPPAKRPGGDTQVRLDRLGEPLGVGKLIGERAIPDEAPPSGALESGHDCGARPAVVVRTLRRRAQPLRVPGPRSRCTASAPRPRTSWPGHPGR